MSGYNTYRTDYAKPSTNRGAQLLREWRSQRRLTIYALADVLGVSTASVIAWLQGTTHPRHKLRPEVERLTGVPTDAWEQPPI